MFMTPAQNDTSFKSHTKLIFTDKQIVANVQSVCLHPRHTHQDDQWFDQRRCATGFKNAWYMPPADHLVHIHSRSATACFRRCLQSAAVFTARRYASAVYALALCVCLSVHLSVTSRYYIKKLNIITNIALYDSLGTLVFWGRNIWENSNGATSTKAPNTGGVS